jgi:methyl-accepting chemotaxis protein
MFIEMTTSKRCSACNKELGPMHCTVCDEYFCSKDFKTHREGIFTEMDKIVEERNRLQDVINNTVQSNDQQNPVIEQINQWQNNIIEKVKQVAAQARQQAIQLMNYKLIKINTEFKDFSQELAHLKESEDYVEPDLRQLNQMISQFEQILRQSTQQTTIKIHTEKSDEINWDSLIYVEKKETSINNQQREQQTASKLNCYFSWVIIHIVILFLNEKDCC